jgi:predicted acetyltransferase
VTVVAERRGDGLLTDLVRALLVEARERGEVLSTLFPTAPGIYRRLGYELIGALDTVELPMAELAAVRAPAGVTTRRATAGDFDAVRRVYETWAAAQNGPLTRRGPSFVASAEEFVGAFTGVTLAVDASGEVVGFASWQRGQGYDPATSTLEADDLLALGADAYRALWRVLGSFSAVTGRLRVSTSGADVARLVLPAGTWRVVDTHPYMLRLLDVAGAFSARSFDGSAEAVLAVTGDPLGLLDGSYRLRVSGGRTTCERVEATDAATFTPQGLALAYAGAQSCANLRMVGHLAGPTTYDATLDRLLGGRRVHIRDYF